MRERAKMGRSRMLAGALIAGCSLAMPAVAMAQTDYTTTPPKVKGETTTRGSDTKVLGTTTSRDPGSLAVTGGDIAGLAALGAGAVGIGTFFVRRGRTRSTATA